MRKKICIKPQNWQKISFKPENWEKKSAFSQKIVTKKCFMSKHEKLELSLKNRTKQLTRLCTRLHAETQSQQKVKVMDLKVNQSVMKIVLLLILAIFEVHGQSNVCFCITSGSCATNLNDGSNNLDVRILSVRKILFSRNIVKIKVDF